MLQTPSVLEGTPEALLAALRLLRAGLTSLATVIDALLGADTFTEEWEGDYLPAPIVGWAAAVQSMSVFYAAFPDLHFGVERDFASGDQGALTWRVTGTHRGEFAGIPPTGRRIEYHACMILQVRDGKIARLRTYLDTGTILRQLGALPGGDQAQEP